MVASSASQGTPKLGSHFAIHYVTCFLCGIGVILLFCRRADGLITFFYGGEYGKVPVFLRGLGAISIVLTFGHYYLDRFLFRMRHPVSRQLIAPLLLGSPSCAPLQN